MMKKILDKYAELIRKVDNFSQRLCKKHAGYISCKKGCFDCCGLKTVSSIEAYMILKKGLERLSIKKQGIIKQLSANAKRKYCVFLHKGSCLVYKQRPLICRTHGYPIYINTKVDFCPVNFKGVTGFKTDDILNIEKITEYLMALNIEFTRKTDLKEFKKPRIRLSRLIRLT